LPLLQPELKRFEFATREGKILRVRMYNLREQQTREEGFGEVKETCALVRSGAIKSKVILVAAGGDGTVKWCISELSKVDCLHVPIGVIPFGTGNDFSRAMGWGASAPKPLIGHNKKALKARMAQMFESAVGPLDTWLVDIKLREGGAFYEVKDGKVQQSHEGQQELTHEMINYFSCGADAKIVYEFEQRRTKSQIGNKMVYVERGMNQMVRRPKRLGALLDKELGFLAEGKTVQFRKHDRIMAFLNIPSYSAGANVWRPGKRKDLQFEKQFVGDKRLEAVSLASTSSVGMHIASRGVSKRGIFRVAQSPKYELKFREGVKAYLQVDGEAIKAENIESVAIRHGYQINVLRSSRAKAQLEAVPPLVELTDITQVTEVTKVAEVTEVTVPKQ